MTEKDLDKLIKNLNEKTCISVDTETSSLKPDLEADLIGVSFSYAPNKALLHTNWLIRKLKV